MHDDKDFFDVTLACDDAQIKTHKVILTAYRSFFRNNAGRILKTTHTVLLRSYMMIKNFLDVTLACDDNQIQAHKIILIAYSNFFLNISEIILKTTYAVLLGSYVMTKTDMRKVTNLPWLKVVGWIISVKLRDSRQFPLRTFGIIFDILHSLWMYTTLVGL